MATCPDKRGEYFSYSRHGGCEKPCWEDEQANNRMLEKFRSEMRLQRERAGIADNAYFTQIFEPTSICYRRQGITLP